MVNVAAFVWVIALGAFPIVTAVRDGGSSLANSDKNVSSDTTTISSSPGDKLLLEVPENNETAGVIASLAADDTERFSTAKAPDIRSNDKSDREKPDVSVSLDDDDIEIYSPTKEPEKGPEDKSDRDEPGVSTSLADDDTERFSTTKAPRKRPKDKPAKDKQKKSGKGSAVNTTSTTKVPRMGKSMNIEEEEISNVTCTSPPEIEGAIAPRVEGTEHVVGMSVAYSCNFGYVSRNSMNHISVCTVNKNTGKGEWTVPEIACIPRSCGDPGYVSNARRIGNLFTFPNKVVYECDEGYKLRGLNARYCQAGGEWSGRLPICEQIYCTVPPDPVNGRVRYSSLEYGTELRYECNVGFMLRQNQPRFCTEDASWSNDEPECIETRCEQPIVPDHGSVKLAGEPKVGSLATYTCDAGRMIIGASTTKCLISGQWTFDPPKCLRFCDVPLIENGEMGKFEMRAINRWNQKEEFNKFFAGERVKSNETLFFRCKTGFLPIDDLEFFESNRVEVACNDGTWSKFLQCKKAFCDGKPPDMENGMPIVTGRTHGFTIWYKCNNKRHTKVPGNVTCIFGSWIGETPKCLDSPCDTKELNHPGLVKPSEELLSSGQSFDIVCENGFIKSISATKVTCNKRKWNITENPCINDHSHNCNISELNYPGLKQPSKLLFSNLENFRIDCEKGYTKSTNKRFITCVESEWDMMENPCTLDDSYRCSTNQLNYPGLKKPSKEFFSHLESFNIICKNGFVKSTVQRIKCVEGEWDLKENPCREGEKNERQALPSEPGGTSAIPQNLSSVSGNQHTSVTQHVSECYCNFDYSNYLVVARAGNKVLERGDNVRQGETVSFQCRYNNNVIGWHNGLRLSTEVNITCSTCQKWREENLPTCMVHRFGDPIIILDKKAKILPNGVAEIPKGERIQLVCSSTWGQPTWQTTTKNASGSRSSSNIGETTTNFAFLYITEQGNEQSVLNQCIIQDGYGSMIARNILELRTTGIVCPMSFTDVSSVSFSKGNQVNSVATFTCPSYAKLVGAVSATCQYDGTWSSSQPSCKAVDIRCPLIDGKGIFSIYYDNERRINSTAQFLCKESGKKVEGCIVSTCLSNRTWSGSFPKCVDLVSCVRFPDEPDLKVVYSKGISVGSTASFTCAPPNVLVGNMDTICQDTGIWNYPSPSCKAPNCSIHNLTMSVPEGVVPDMTLVTGEFMPMGSEIQLECEDNLIMNGNSKAVCGSFGKWQLGTFQCVPGCLLKVDPSSHLLIQPLKDNYRFGEFVLLSCPPGEEMSYDVERLMCLGKAWSHSIPDCKVSK